MFPKRQHDTTGGRSQESAGSFHSALGPPKLSSSEPPDDPEARGVRPPPPGPAAPRGVAATRALTLRRAPSERCGLPTVVPSGLSRGKEGAGGGLFAVGRVNLCSDKAVGLFRRNKNTLCRSWGGLGGEGCVTRGGLARPGPTRGARGRSGRIVPASHSALWSANQRQPRAAVSHPRPRQHQSLPRRWQPDEPRRGAATVLGWTRRGCQRQSSALRGESRVPAGAAACGTPSAGLAATGRGAGAGGGEPLGGRAGKVSVDGVRKGEGRRSARGHGATGKGPPGSEGGTTAASGCGEGWARIGRWAGETPSAHWGSLPTAGMLVAMPPPSLPC